MTSFYQHLRQCAASSWEFTKTSPAASVRPFAAFLLMACGSHADVFSNVPSAADYQVAYELAIPVNGAFQGATVVPYTVNNSATAAPGGFDRVAYYLELTNASGTTWVYASMDAFTTAVGQTGLPHAVSNPVSIQQSVSNLEVYSNVSSVKSGSFDRGQIEMWHPNYSAADPNAVFASSASTYDWGDTLGTTASGYGCFQIHNPGSKQVVLAYNHWSADAATNDDVGIGSSTGTHPDWTFAANTASYTARKLVVLVRPKRFTVSFTTVPVNQQVTPRNVTTNVAAVPVAGKETTGGFDKAVLKILRNGAPYGTAQEQTLTYVSGAADFSFNPNITAELASYTFEIYLKQGALLRLVRRISDITAGDVFLWYGQSNSEAAVRSGSANAYASPWIRTFGMSSDDATVTQAYSFWVEANGDGSRSVPAGVGQWALVVGRKVVDTQGIPVAILNGARGGYSMPQLQRDDANLNNLADSTTTPVTYRVYNRLRYRTLQAKVASGVRAIFYYQGESDVNNTAQHVAGFASLMADWKVDYPAVERIFVSQLHVGCSTTRELPELRDAQRLLPDVYDNVRIISTNGLTTHTDNCHYPFAGGYETHGLNSFRQVARELYGAPDSPAIDAPNPARVEIANEAGTRLRIVLRKSGAGIVVDAAALVDFRLTGSAAVLQSAAVTASSIELQYDRPLNGATRLDYLAHIGNAAGWVRNSNGVGLLAFSEPVPNDLPQVTLVSPSGAAEISPGTVVPLSATATTAYGTVSRMEIHINGILYTANGPGNSIADGWTIPASGTYQIIFRATGSNGKTGEASVVIFAGTTVSPGGVGNGLSVWLKPENGIIRDAAGVVSSWQDSSGNGNHCSQSTAAAKPTYQPNRFGTLPGVDFDGGDWLASTAGMGTGSYTKVVRVSLTDLAQPGNMLSSGAASGPVRHALFMASATTPRIWHGSSFCISNTSMVANQGHILVATYDAATTTGTLYLDGVQVGTGTAANNADPSYQLGAIAASNFLRGSIGEAIVYNRVITPAERAAVDSYLLAKSQAPPNTPLLDYASWSSQNIPVGKDSGAAGDFNGNGIANAVEFALGIDPASSGMPQPVTLQTNSGIVNVSYFRPTNRTGVGYQLFQSFDLQSWSPVPDLAGPVSHGIEERKYQRTLSPEQHAFFRLQVTLPSPP